MRTVQGDDEKFDHAFETGGLDVDDEDEVDQRERCFRIAMSLSAVLVDRSALPAASFIRRIIESILITGKHMGIGDVLDIFH